MLFRYFRLYENIFEFVKTLNEWKCNKETIKECLLDCIENLIEKKFLERNNLEFYNAWLDDLDKIGYKWPAINRSVKKRIVEKKLKIFHKSNEQKHSSNSNENEQSAIESKLNVKQIKFVEKYCQIQIDKSKERCKLDKIVMVTYAKTSQDIEHIVKLINIHITYIVICLDKNRDVNLTDSYLNSILIDSTGLTFVLIEKNDYFKYCIKKAMNIGFKQQAFLILKDFRLFSHLIAQKNIEFKNLNESSLIDLDNLKKDDENNLNKYSYFIRKNVANGIRLVNTYNSNESQTICHYYKNNTDEELCSNWLNSLDNLSWHQNDLASEYCENLKSRTIFIPDFHYGPRNDISSTMISLGK